MIRATSGASTPDAEQDNVASKSDAKTRRERTLTRREPTTGEEGGEASNNADRFIVGSIGQFATLPKAEGQRPGVGEAQDLAGEPVAYPPISMGRLATLSARLDPDPGVRGKQFELICRWYLRTDPLYRRELKRVWLWDEWPGRWGADAGIDLVAEARDGGRFLPLEAV